MWTSRDPTAIPSDKMTLHNRSGTHAGVGAIALKVLAVDEGLNALLEVALLHGELQLRQQLRHQQLVAQRLPRLHHPHYGRVNLRTPSLSVSHSFTGCALTCLAPAARVRSCSMSPPRALICASICTNHLGWQVDRTESTAPWCLETPHLVSLKACHMPVAHHRQKAQAGRWRAPPSAAPGGPPLPAGMCRPGVSLTP